MENLNFTSLQKLVFDEFSQEKDLKKKFYFGGGTALSVFYLHHRYSDDLDFFSKSPLDPDEIIAFINKISRKVGVAAKMTKKEMVMLFEFHRGKDSLKVDFLYFPYHQIDKGIEHRSISVDSLKDIGANKLLTVNLETNPKDYVDLYFIINNKLTLWDLLYAVEAKFNLQLDLIALGEDFLEAEKIAVLPRMIKSLTLKELKSFFRKKAEILGKKVTI